MDLETARLKLQSELDAAKTQSERNKLGQFSTPPRLAEEVVRRAINYRESADDVRFIDPAFGTGAFYSALLRVVSQDNISAAWGFEIDRHYGAPSRELWRSHPLCLRLEDFTKAAPPPCGERFNLLVCNPPYVRHHHLSADDKRRLGLAALRSGGVKLSGLAGLYCYFMMLCHHWLDDGGIGAWLVPSEFMNVNYGAAIKQYLLDRVTLLEIHRFSPQDVQFEDALVSSAVVYYRKGVPRRERSVLFTYGGALGEPIHSREVPTLSLQLESKWTKYPQADDIAERPRVTVGDIFSIKRGIATGDNSFFILTPDQVTELEIPDRFLRPILPPPRMVREMEVPADQKGRPALSIPPRFLLDCGLTEEEVREGFPKLWAYLESGRARVASRYLCQHRAPWYAQEQRPPAPIVCTYLGRRRSDNSKPFRFILNHSEATAPNVYLLLYPKPWVRGRSDLQGLLRSVWTALNAVPTEMLLGEGRVYGGGLHKLEPRELANVPLDIDGLPLSLPERAPEQSALFV